MKLKLFIIGFVFLLIGSFLVISNVGWGLWFGIMLLIVSNNISSKLLEMEDQDDEEKDRD